MVNVLKTMMAKQHKKKQALTNNTKEENNETGFHENGLLTEAQVGIQGFIKKGREVLAQLNQCYSDLQVHEISMDGKICHLTNLDQSKKKKENPKGKLSMVKNQDSNIVPFQPLYTQFVLYMENQNTDVNLLLSEIAKKNKISCPEFKTAGSKHEIGKITCQLVTANKNLNPKKMNCDLKSESKVVLGNFTFADKPLQQGSIKGNRFIIAFRNVIGQISQIEENLESLKENGFINYYGIECFGKKAHLIGKLLLLNQLKEAIDFILEEFKGQQNFCSMVTQLLSYMKKHKDLIGALNTIPYEMRLSYIKAYQNFIWNKIVSKRISKFGVKPIPGDLVNARSIGGEGIDSRIEMCDDESCKNSDQTECNLQKIVIIDENNIKDYMIYDVMLPLPGSNITYPANEVGNWYKDLLLADGLSEKDFKRNAKNYSLAGAYRHLILKPSDVNWKFVHYSNPTERLVLSDLDRLENAQSQYAATVVPEEQTKPSKMGTKASGKRNLEISSTSNSLESSELDDDPVLTPSLNSDEDNDTIPMSYAVKKQLSCDIRMLPGEKLGRIVHIFRSLEPELGGSDPNEVVLDLEKLQKVTLRTLQIYVDSCLTRKSLKTYENKQLNKEEERKVINGNLTDEKVGANCTGGKFLGLVLEFNLPPSSYATMVIREIMKISSGVFENENDTSKHSSQGTIKYSYSEKSQIKRPEMQKISIVSEITSSSDSESEQKPREKRLKLCDLS